MTKENTARNTRAERHAKRMLAQTHKHYFGTVEGEPVSFEGMRVPRGTARNERRKPLQMAYAKRMVNAA